MDREAIKAILPHRDDMLLLDEAWLEGEEACARYHVRGNEFFLRGHFPGNPIVPGVIQCEILAQSACVLLGNVLTDGKLPMYTGMDKVRFRVPIHPGDTLETRCRLTRTRPPFYFAEGSVSVEGKICTTASFSFAVMGE